MSAFTLKNCSYRLIENTSCHSLGVSSNSKSNFTVIGCYILCVVSSLHCFLLLHFPNWTFDRAHDFENYSWLTLDFTESTTHLWSLTHLSMWSQVEFRIKIWRNLKIFLKSEETNKIPAPFVYLTLLQAFGLFYTARCSTEVGL